MVDLVKIRKKKAEQKAEQKAKAVEESPSLPVAQSPSEVPPATQQPSNPATEEPRDRGPEEPTGQPGDRATGQPTKLDKFKEVAGKKRAAEATKLETAALPSAHLELLTFIIAGEQYAVDIERIVEIVTPRAVTRIPNAEFSVVGIISLRGTIVTLVDVRRKLRHPAAGEPTADTRIVVIDYEKEMIGFVVDRVLRVVKPGADEIEAHPVVHATELDESIRGVFRVSGALTILLDLDKLLDSRALAST
jgi:chemotaxis signal transduction protein